MPHITLPIAGVNNTRVSAVGAIPSSVAIAGIAVSGVAICGRTVQPTSKDSRFINCYVHSVNDPVTSGKRTYCVKRSGWQALNTPQAGSLGNQIIVWTGQSPGTKVITSFGSTNSSIYDGTSRLTTNNGDTTVITGTATGITETVISATATLTITSSDSTAWYYQNAGTVTKITNANFPGNNSLTLAGTFAHMDGYAFVMDTAGTVWHSDLNSVTSWSANSKIDASTYPDKGIAVIRWKTYIIGFGPESMEFFQNAGNPTGSVLNRVPAMAQRIGAVSANAIAQISDNIFFVGSTPQGGLTLFQFNGNISRISTPEIDAILLLSGAGNINVTTLRDAGLSFVIVNGSGLTYVYLVEDKFWFQWNGPSVLWTKCAGVSVGTSQLSYAISSLATSGKVYQINPSSRVFQDDSKAYTATAQLPTVDPAKGFGMVAYQQVQLKADVETGTSNVTLSWSDDDYTTFSSGVSLDLTQNTPRASWLGGTKNPRAFMLSHSDNTPFRLQEMRLRVIGGMP